MHLVIVTQELEILPWTTPMEDRVQYIISKSKPKMDWRGIGVIKRCDFEKRK